MICDRDLTSALVQDMYKQRNHEMIKDIKKTEKARLSVIRALPIFHYLIG